MVQVCRAWSMQVNFNLLLCFPKQSFLSHVNKKEKTTNVWAFFHVRVAVWEAERSHGDVTLQPAKQQASRGKERRAFTREGKKGQSLW